MGGTAAYQVGNPTAATLMLQQSINAPASLDYCLSLYARSDQSTQVWLVRGSATDRAGDQPAVDAADLRRAATGHRRFHQLRHRAGSGRHVDVFGIQAEAQTTASIYKQTAETGGVYPNARFRDDTLTITTVGPSRHSCELDIVNVEYL
jgi:hypothetical protein